MALKSVPPCILGVGTNYPCLSEELNVESSEQVVAFFKNPASIIGNGDPIVLSPVTRTAQLGVDYEGELAVILGQDACNVSEDDALNYISHVAVANDVTQRYWQKLYNGGQWFRSKSFDTFCPLSEPVNIKDVGGLQNLLLETRLNGELVQQANTGSMIFSVANLVAQLSSGTTLMAGTVLLTGTPAGVGMGRNPQRFLRAGDCVEITIEGVGKLSNPVVELD